MLITPADQRSEAKPHAEASRDGLSTRTRVAPPRLNDCRIEELATTRRTLRASDGCNKPPLERRHHSSWTKTGEGYPGRPLHLKELGAPKRAQEATSLPNYFTAGYPISAPVMSTRTQLSDGRGHESLRCRQSCAARWTTVRERSLRMKRRDSVQMAQRGVVGHRELTEPVV